MINSFISFKNLNLNFSFPFIFQPLDFTTFSYSLFFLSHNLHSLHLLFPLHLATSIATNFTISNTNGLLAVCCHHKGPHCRLLCSISLLWSLPVMTSLLLLLQGWIFPSLFVTSPWCGNNDNAIEST